MNVLIRSQKCATRSYYCPLHPQQAQFRAGPRRSERSSSRTGRGSGPSRVKLLMFLRYAGSTPKFRIIIITRHAPPHHQPNLRSHPSETMAEDPERQHEIDNYLKALRESREAESRLKELRFELKDLTQRYDQSEQGLQALQSVGQIIGEVLKQLDEERCKRHL